MFEILTAVSLYVWLVVLFEFCLLCTFVETKNGPAATVSLIVFLAALQFLFGVDVYTYCKTNPAWVGMWALGYIIGGLTWGSCKWTMFSRECRRKYDQAKLEFMKKKGVVGISSTPIPVEFQQEWQQIVKDSYNPKISPYPPQVIDYKADLIRWSSWWIASFVSWILHDFIHGIWTFAYNLIGKTLQHVANRQFAGVANDFPDPTQIKKRD